ncbi:hypothetical protein SDC9_163176 [bioreactor metagenome]|uniref:Uncharacterized protein n=1 Tax=bioreactor metagenome TaxID=1076179 RepID=A0A645FPF7_9ZZZZ
MSGIVDKVALLLFKPFLLTDVLNDHHRFLFVKAGKMSFKRSLHLKHVQIKFTRSPLFIYIAFFQRYLQQLCNRFWEKFG